MAAPTLVISHPPHGDVDPKLAAPVLGLAPVDVRLKANYPVPEIWLAEAAAAERTAGMLREAGLRVAVVPGTGLAEIAPRQVVARFAFEEGGLLLRADECSGLGYGVPTVAIQFAPRPGDARGTEPLAFLDLYALAGGELRRWTVLQGTTAFDGLGSDETPSFGTNVQALATRLEGRFQRLVLDRRLVHMQVRKRAGTPPPGAVRRGYSFATAALNTLLESIAPGLSELEHQDLSSRLAFLTQAAR